MKEGGVLCNSGKYQTELGACFYGFCPPFSRLFPISHFCSVRLVPPSGPADDNYPAQWSFVSTPVLIIHCSSADDFELFKTI